VNVVILTNLIVSGKLALLHRLGRRLNPFSRAATEGCGPLPTPEEMIAHLRRGGFSRVKAKKLYPFEEFSAFVRSA